jgi:hypothetical protein
MSATQQNNRKLRLKKNKGWFPAGESFINAMSVLSDHTFKLFVFVCLSADRETATYTASSTRLAAVLGRSRSAVDRDLAELRDKRVCLVDHIPYAGITFRVMDAYWPYECGGSTGIQTDGPYVDAVRNLFLGLGCTSDRFGPPEIGQARDLEKRGISLHELEDAMIVGACRKYVSWLSNGLSDPIASLHYFESLIEEIRERPFPPGYRDHLRMEVKKLAGQWERVREQNHQLPAGDFSETASSNSNILPIRLKKETRS